MPTGFHPNPHFFSAHLELTVELLRFLAVPQFPLVPFTTVRIDKRNLLESRVTVTTDNDHVRLLSPEPWLVSRHQSLLGRGSRHCYGIITLTDRHLGDDQQAFSNASSLRSHKNQEFNRCSRLSVLKNSLHAML